LTDQQVAQAMVSNARWAQRLGWGAQVEAIGVLLGVAGAAAGAPAFAQAVAGWQRRRDLGVDGVIGPKSWTALKLELSPPASLTGILPPDLPPVPNGFAEVLAAYGDPRPLLSADGSLSPDNEALWQRQTLSRGTLPFPIPVEAGKVKTSFYAHHKLVSAFEAVFEEIARLGLQDHIRSWGGIYNFRPIRGTTARLSLHCFGAAIDLNSESNKLGSEGDMSPRVVEVFEHFGFLWGGNFRGRSDPMHFQYARGY
jgi:hypothetical protein